MNNEFPSLDQAGASTPSRRRLFAMAALLAAFGGGGFGLWRYRENSANDLVQADFWQLKLPTPTGPELAMADFRGRPLLLNFWATWCPPCIEELPLLDAFFRQNSPKGWQVLGIAVDKPSAVKAFLSRHPLSFPIAMAGLTGSDLSKTMGNIGGGLPFSVLVDSAGVVAKRKIGKVSLAELSQWSELK